MNYKEILYLYSPVHNDIFPHAKVQVYWLYGYWVMVIQEQKGDEEHGKIVESTFWDIRHVIYLINQFLHTGYFSHILHLDITKSEINEIENENPYNYIYGFQWG